MSVVRVYDGEDPVERHRRYKKQPWIKRQGKGTWLLLLCGFLFLIALCALAFHYGPGILENGIDLNPIAPPANYQRP
jgi:hypothetical protein